MAEATRACFISDSRRCKPSSITKQVFIIGSGSPEFVSDIQAIKDTLEELDLKGNFALLSEDSKGQDAFCNKICSRIMGAEFCIAMLNDPVMPGHPGIRIPSANVYYEYGLAIAQGKNVIPVLRKGMTPPFDVQHLDLIIYIDVDDLKKKLKKPIVANLRRNNVKSLVLKPAANTEAAEKVYGPLFGELKNVISTLEQKQYDEVSLRSWSEAQSDNRQFMVDKQFRERLNTFLKATETFSTAINSLSNIIVPRIMRKTALEVFKEDPGDNPLNFSFTYKTESGDNRAVGSSLTYRDLKLNIPISTVVENSLWLLKNSGEQFTISGMKISYAKTNNRGPFENDNRQEIERYWESCRQKLNSDAKYQFVANENEKLLEEAKDIKAELVRRMEGE